MNIEIANRLVELRKKNNLSQEELAQKLGLSRQSVSKWERAEASPDTDNLICLAKIYGVSLDDLLNTSEPIEQIVKETKEKEEERYKTISSSNLDEEDIDDDDDFDDKSNKKDKGKEEIHIGPGHIYVHNDTEHVDIGLGHIHVIDEDGTEVHIGNGHSEFPHWKDFDKDKKQSTIKSIIFVATLLCSLAAYLLMGFLWNESWTYGVDNSGWCIGWIVFFIPFIVSSIVEGIQKKKASKFNMVFFVIPIYLSLGMILGLWHPTWAIFFAIPVYYVIFKNVEKHIATKQTSKVVKDINEDK